MQLHNNIRFSPQMYVIEIKKKMQSICISILGYLSGRGAAQRLASIKVLGSIPFCLQFACSPHVCLGSLQADMQVS